MLISLTRSTHYRVCLVLFTPVSKTCRAAVRQPATMPLPMKSPNGLAWRTLLDPEMVNDAIMARAEATNPAAAEHVRELTEIRAMQVTIAGVALAEIEPS